MGWEIELGHFLEGAGAESWDPVDKDRGAGSPSLANS